MRVCSLSEIPIGEGLRVETPVGAVAVFQVTGIVYVVQDLCTHAGGSLSDGRCKDGWIECPIHRGRFDLVTGAPIKPPCVIPIKTYNVTLVGEEVHIDGGIEGVPT
jgi:anthranilate 1,2-dioxygenase ferredoxin subunit